MSGIPERIRVVDSHTEGEPTRVVIDGWPQPPGATMADRREYLREHQEALRRAVVCEPRGHAAIVGALLTPPVSAEAQAGIVFFNNGTYLGMCGHGLIGVVATLRHLGRIGAGEWAFDTPAGPVRAQLADDGMVTIRNVSPRVHALDVTVDVPGVGRVTGDVVYGGNWFFLAHHSPLPLTLGNAAALTRVTQSIQEALDAAGITGDDGSPIDHIELAGPPTVAGAHARNFVLCSGGDYDRSPCGTGTSAVMAAQHARGALAANERWRQESITGSVFTGWLESDGDRLVPYVQGRAFITAESTLVLDPSDPFRSGFGA